MCPSFSLTFCLSGCVCLLTGVLDQLSGIYLAGSPLTDLSLSRARALSLSLALARLLARALSLLAGSPLTVQCDIWGFGVILWELLSEQIPVLCTRVNPAHTCISARATDYECTENPHPRIRTILQDNPCLCVCVFVCVCARAWWWCVVRSASPIDTSSDL